MFSYMIVVNDNGELKSVSQEDFESHLVLKAFGGTAAHAVDEALNAILDEFSRDDEIEERLRERRAMTDGQ